MRDKREQLLKANGFHLKRTSGHAIWSDGIMLIPLHTGKKVPPYEMRSLRSKIKKALRKRAEMKEAHHVSP